MSLLSSFEKAVGAAASNIEHTAGEIVTNIQHTAGEIVTDIQKALPPPFGPGPTKAPSESKSGAPVTTTAAAPSPVDTSSLSPNTITNLPSDPSTPPPPSSTSDGGGSEPTSIEDPDSSTSSQDPQFLSPLSSSATILEAGDSFSPPTTSSHGIAPSLSAGPPTSTVQAGHHTDESKGLSSPGALAGTVVGGLVASGVLVVFIMFLLKWRRRRRQGGFSPMDNRASRTWMDESNYGDPTPPAVPLVRDSIFDTDTPGYSAAPSAASLVRAYSTHSSDSLASGATLGEIEQYYVPNAVSPIDTAKTRSIAEPVPGASEMRTSRPSTPVTFARGTPPPSYRPPPPSYRPAY